MFYKVLILLYTATKANKSVTEERSQVENERSQTFPNCRRRLSSATPLRSTNQAAYLLRVTSHCIPLLLFLVGSDLDRIIKRSSYQDVRTPLSSRRHKLNSPTNFLRSGVWVHAKCAPDSRRRVCRCMSNAKSVKICKKAPTYQCCLYLRRLRTRRPPKRRRHYHSHLQRRPSCNPLAYKLETTRRNCPVPM